MEPLPVDPFLPAITAAVRRARGLVLVAPPGAGKTTRVPPALVRELPAASGRLLLLQPRRIAARAAAARIADEQGWTLGEEVGYQVRFENRTGPRTRLHVMTEGILLRRLHGDPFLEGVAAVVLDEFHERSLEADLALAMLREIRESGRDDLVVAVMSATLEPDPVAHFLGDCPVVVAEGRPHPVEIRHVEPGGRTELADSIGRVVRESWSATTGHLLVFLPGIAEIRRVARVLEEFARSRNALLLPLHGSLPLRDQQAALEPTSRRKILLATNVAETSLTIDGVDQVIDAGLVRQLRSDPRHGIDRLETVRISRHSAEQRAGRAGRQRPGRALRLWSRREHAALVESDVAEVQRVDLCRAVLEVKSWGTREVESFGWFERPDPAALRRAEELLAMLGALEEPGGPLTPTGQLLQRLPVHPRLGRILLEAARRGCLREATRLVALLEERDVVRRTPTPPHAPSVSGPSDLLWRAELVEQFSRGRPVDPGPGLQLERAAVHAVERLAQSLETTASRELADVVASERGSGDAALLRALLHGYPDRVVRRRAPGSERGVMVGGRGVVQLPGSIVQEATLYVALDLDESTRGARLEARVRLASAIERAWLEEDLPERIREVAATTFDRDSGRVRATRAVRYFDLELERPREATPEPVEAEAFLAGEVRQRGLELFERDESAAAWLARCRFLTRAMPELALPAFDEARLGELLAAACAGKTTLEAVTRQDLVALLRGALGHDRNSLLERHAPERLEVPSGSRIRLRYEDEGPPVLAVRLQEMFGLAETPRVAGGRVAVLLHLLGPNFRPVQVTADLESFWNNTYPQVRKDLRARYPRHAWPEDPWSATPIAGPRRR